jgi:hypothetical protein
VIARAAVPLAVAAACLLLIHTASADPSLSVSAPDARRGETSVVRLTLAVPEGSWLVAGGAAEGTPLTWTVDERPSFLTFGAVHVPEATPGVPGHRGRVTLSVPVTPALDAPDGEHAVLTTLRWQLCDGDGCASTLTQQLPIPVRVLPPSPPPEARALPTR